MSLGAVLLLALPAMLAAPFAARLARRLPQLLLTRLFAFCLFAISARVVFRAIG